MGLSPQWTDIVENEAYVRHAQDSKIHSNRTICYHGRLSKFDN